MKPIYIGLFLLVGLSLVLFFIFGVDRTTIENGNKVGPIAYGDGNVAVIIEPRKHAALSLVVRNIYEELGDDWVIQVFHGTENGDWCKDLLKDLKDRVEFVNTGWSNFKDGNAYSLYVNSLNFWTQVKHENVLVFQTDSVILPGSPHVIEEFMKYDYIGSPWEFFDEWPQGRVGCGGFSFRKRSAMIDVIVQTPPDPKDRWEDLYFVEMMEQKPERYSIAPVDVAQKFCVGSLYYETPFSVHQCWNGGLPADSLATLEKRYPIVAQLRELQHVV